MPPAPISTAELIDRKIRGYAQLDAIDDFCHKRRKSSDTVEEEDEEEFENEEKYENESDTLLWTSVLMLMIIAVVHAALTLFSVIAIRSLHDTSKEQDTVLDDH